MLSVSDPGVPLAAARNTAGLAAAEVLRRSAATTGLELSINKGLPLAGGLGGSAASAVAAVVAANLLLGTVLTPLEQLEIALDAEGAVSGRHADNVAPSLMGGAVLVRGLDPPSLARVAVAPGLCFVLATPDYRVETARARQVLPAQVSRADAVAQAASLAALLLGLQSGDPDLLRHSMTDRIAEPARAALYPGYTRARQAALDAGAWGVAVSGAGPSVVALVPDESGLAVSEALVEGYRATGIAARSFQTGVDVSGARAV